MIIDAWLQAQLQQADDKTLYCLDENASLPNAAFAGLILTNRYDLYQKAQAHSRALFNDFDFSALTERFSSAIYRIGKDKSLNIHIIKHLLAKLPEGGQLVLLGARDEGIESLIKLIKSHTQALLQIEKSKQQYRCIIPACNSDAIPSHYSQWQTLELHQRSVFSKPGIFGWQKIDQGSQLLIQCLAEQAVNSNAQLLDLGAGYGYLSLAAKHLGYQHIDATDNNAASVLACQKNFAAWNIQGQAIADDCASGINKRYDLVLCNPPFHQGFSHNKSLTHCFCSNVSRLLKADGQAFFVVNQFIGVEKYCQGLFKQCQLLVQSKGFKVFLLKK